MKSRYCSQGTKERKSTNLDVRPKFEFLDGHEFAVLPLANI